MRREWADIAFVLPAGGDLPHDDRTAVLQRYGRVVIATVADHEADEVRAVAGDGLVVAGHRHGGVDAATWSSLDPAERLALEGYWLRHSEDYQRQKEERPGQGVVWNHPDFTPPDPPEGVDLTTAAGLTDRLRGSVAIGLVMVSGPGDLVFTGKQQAQVVAEVQSGLGWLGSMWQMRRVRFDVEIHTPEITVPADPKAPDLEGLWRNPAMKAIKQGEGEAGVRSFAKSLKDTKATDSAYVSFFTHYPLKHFAYSAPSWPETVMQYSNDGWTPYGIDRVFAHETGHVFGAPDEYDGQCVCGEKYGYYHVPNDNCARCDGGGKDCIMNNNLFYMCAWTPRHVGAPIWWVNGADYIASPPAVVGDVIYYRGTNNYLYRIKNDGTGPRKFDDKTSSTPFVVGDVIYYRGTNNYLYQVNTDGTNGKVIGGNKLLSTPFVTGGYIYYQGTNDYLYRVKVGETNGSNVGSNKLSSSPFVTGGVIYFQGTNNYLYRVNTDGTDGRKIGVDRSLSSPFVSDGVIYYQGTDNGLYRVDTDGKNSRLIGENYTISTPCVAGGYVYYQGTNCHLYRVKTDGSAGEMLTSSPIRSSPVVVDNVVYFEGNDLLFENRLYMINLT